MVDSLHPKYGSLNFKLAGVSYDLSDDDFWVLSKALRNLGLERLKEEEQKKCLLKLRYFFDLIDY